jgi:hypothetical protein
MQKENEFWFKNLTIPQFSQFLFVQTDTNEIQCIDFFKIEE